MKCGTVVIDAEGDFGRKKNLSSIVSENLIRAVVRQNVWLRQPQTSRDDGYRLASQEVNYEVIESEEAVGRLQFDELQEAARNKKGDLVIILLGGRGAQAFFRLVGELARTDEIDHLLSRLHVFTQDALAPLRMDNGLSFVRDFERLLGRSFFEKVKSFTPMQTDTNDLETGLEQYLEKLESLGGIDIFFLGLGPEADAASHLAYIKPGSGATINDLAGVIPISPSILEHHISKFQSWWEHSHRCGRRRMSFRNSYSYAWTSRYSQGKEDCPINRGCEHCASQARQFPTRARDKDFAGPSATSSPTRRESRPLVASSPQRANVSLAGCSGKLGREFWKLLLYVDYLHRGNAHH